MKSRWVFGLVILISLDGLGLYLWGHRAFPIYFSYADSAQASFFPDGTRLAVAAKRAWRQNIFVIHKDGSNAQQLTKYYFSEESYDPAVSHDGSKIVFIGRARFTDKMAICIMNSDGSEEKQITKDGSGHYYGPSFSPDDSKIVYAKQDASYKDLGIFIMNTDGTDEQNIYSGIAGDPYYSPDGKTVICSGTVDHKEQTIFSINISQRPFSMKVFEQVRGVSPFFFGRWKQNCVFQGRVPSS